MLDEFDIIDDVVRDLKRGKLVIVTDDVDRENEGDLVCLGEYATPEAINFMITYGRGLVCAPISSDIARRLELPPMTPWNSDPLGTAFTVSIDHQDTSTGISAADRSLTIHCLTSPNSKTEDFHRPGHIFPLVARDGGVLFRPGHTEAAIDLTRLCGAVPVAVICEILDADGSMARLPKLLTFARQYNLKITSIATLVAYLQSHEQGTLQRDIRLTSSVFGT